MAYLDDPTILQPFQSMASGCIRHVVLRAKFGQGRQQRPRRIDPLSDLLTQRIGDLSIRRSPFIPLAVHVHTITRVRLQT